MTHWFCRPVVVLAMGVALVAAFAPRAGAAPATPEQVDAAVQRAKAYIYSQVKKDNWEAEPAPKGDKQQDPAGKQWGGTTALAVYGLLAAGENPQDPKIKPAIEWLKKAQIGGTYAVGMRAQVWTFLKDENEAKLASDPDFQILKAGLCSDDKRIGLYSYYVDLATGQPQKDWWDHSASQYGVLGMWACEQAHHEIPNLYWTVVDRRWKADQAPDGGWNYNSSNPTVTGTMTAAGLATLYITQDYLLQADQDRWKKLAGGVKNEHIDKGLAWMDKHIGGMLHGDEHNNYYGMYGIERIGVASGRKFFGTVDWYQVGAEELVKKQAKDGSWGAEDPIHNPRKLADTVFAVLFLVRGRAPVAINKLEYANVPDPKSRVRPQDDPWNERPRDVANFAHWAGRQTENYLNWQIVNLKVSPDTLHDAPVLWISGSEALNLSDEDVKKLREYVESGGMILGNADGGSQAFAKSFIALGRKLFPDRYEFQPLRPNHLIYTDQQFRPTKWRTKPQVLTLSNNVRELMILIPEADLGRAFQTRSEKTKEELYQLAQDIFLYSISRSEMRYRGQTYALKADPKVKAERKVTVARIMVGDNPDPEPGGWRRLGNLLHNTAKIDVTVTPVTLVDNKLAAEKRAADKRGVAMIAHLTGTSKFKLTPDQQKRIKEFVAAGGTLLVDAAGASSDFANSAEAELAAMFGGAPGNVGTLLEPNDPLYTWPGNRIERFGYRSFAKRTLVSKLSAPRIRGIVQNGRTAVFYSREDLSAGMVGEPVDGIYGYAPETATEIARNIVLYASYAGKPPATQPATQPETKPSAKPPASARVAGAEAQAK